MIYIRHDSARCARRLGMGTIGEARIVMHVLESIDRNAGRIVGVDDFTVFFKAIARDVECVNPEECPGVGMQTERILRGLRRAFEAVEKRGIGRSFAVRKMIYVYRGRIDAFERGDSGPVVLVKEKK